MDLSNDLISKFVKITSGNDKKESKEGTVYGTAVDYDGAMYVKIDGSDLLTPINTTTTIKDGERVTIMIKDHNATVTGNLSSPSASDADVQKVTRNVETLSGNITEVETLLADAVYTNELDAEVARIDELIAGRATIEQLNATNANVENLVAKDAEIENLVATKATITDLEATNAEIESLQAKDAEIENLVATKATIEDLTATNAEITNLKASKADITYLDANFATIDQLKATNADIEVLDAEFADIQTLVNGNLTSDNIASLNLTSTNTTIQNGMIKDAMIDTVTANKIMSGTIDTNNITIQSTDGSMLLQGTLLQMKDENGKVRIQIGKDGGGNFTFVLYDANGTGVLIDESGIQSSDAIADGLIVDAKVAENANISGSKLDIASVVSEVNNGTTTIKSNKIYLDEEGQTLDVAFNTMQTSVSENEESIKTNSTLISAAQGNITTLIAENESRETEIAELNASTTQLSSNYTSLQQDLSGFKTTVSETYATKTSVTDLSDNLSSNYSTTSAMNSAINQKANEITQTVSETYTTKTEFNNLDIGGTNLVTGTQDFSDWRYHTYYMSPYNEDAIDSRFTGMYIVYDYDAAADAYCDLVKSKAVRVEPNTTYILSFWARGHGKFYTHLHGLTGTVASHYNSSGYSGTQTDGASIHTLTSNDTYQRYWVVYTTGSEAQGDANLIVTRAAQNLSTDVSMIIYGVKFEKGNKPTDWSPCPTEVDNAISSMETRMTSAEQKITADAIVNTVTGSSSWSTQTSNISAAQSTANTANTTANSALNKANTNATNISSLTTRVSTAESKLTKDSLTTTIGSYYTTSADVDTQIVAKGYATTSQVTQTSDALSAKFSSSGGYNLIKNSTGANGTTSGWTHNATTLGVGMDDGISADSRYFLYLDGGTSTTEKFAYSSRFKLMSNTTYRFTGYFHNHTACSNFEVLLLASTTLVDTNTTKLYDTLISIISPASTGGYWRKYTTTFTTPADVKSGYIRIDNNGYDSSGTGDNCVHWHCLTLTKGELEVPWSPHPSEVYDGITTIDKDGIRVSQSDYGGATTMRAHGLYVNDGTEDVLYCTKDGLYVKGNVTVTGGSVPSSILSGTISSSQLNSSITSDISTAKSNASTALSTANSAETTATSAQTTANTANTNATTALNTANSVNTTVNNSKTNWDNAYNRVVDWAYGAVSGTTTIDGGYIQADTIIAEKIAVGDFTNYVVCKPNSSTTNANGGTEPCYDINRMNHMSLTNKLYDVSAGDKFLIKGSVKCGTTADSIYIEGVWRDSRGGFLKCSSVTMAGTASSTVTKSLTLTVPTKPTDASYFAIKVSSSDTSSGVLLLNPNIRLMNTAEMIVDGAITADKIAADAINGKTITGGTITGTTINNGSGTFKVDSNGALTATNATITGTVNAIAGTFAGTVETTTIMKALGGVYAGTELWGGFSKNSSGNYESLSTFKVHATNNIMVSGSYVYLYPTGGEVRVGDTSSYSNLRAREIYAQEIVYTDDIRTRSAAQIGMSNISMASANGFIEFSSGYGVIRVPDVNHLYLQTGGGAANTSSEVRCTAYKDASTYVNLRAYNVCAQNAVYAAGVNVSSDRNRKRDIEEYGVDALNEVCSTPVYAYHLDVDKDEEMKRIGLIMQEAPVDAINLTGQGIDLYQMCSMMWKAIQQLNAKLEG